METINVQYKITPADYRAAAYYGLLARNRRIILFAGSFAVMALFYAILGQLGVISVGPWVYAVGIAYVVWAALMALNMERGIRTYMKSKDCLIGVPYYFTFAGERIRFHIPAQNVRRELSVKKLTVFELRSVFLLYENAQQAYIVPKSAFTPDHISQMRAAFRKMIPDSFRSKY
ncbi:MAG: YcxB family protein [Lachnospiraceae bacterium]|nr:YcxB family protein [Lachnospiraceae bacterium]